MAWSTVYTQAWSTNADNHTFMQYFFDTYLPGKLGWSTSAHPGGAAYRRSVQISLPTPWLNGANGTSYFWVSWTSTSPNSWTWYQDATYTSVPGDTGSDTTNAWGTATAWSAFPGDWRIWASSTDPEAILVTKAKSVVFYWPGPAEWNLRIDQNWDGSADDNSACFGPFIGQAYANLLSGNYPAISGSSTSEYMMTSDIGHTAFDWTIMSGGPYYLVTGVQWLTSASTSNNYPTASSNIAIPRTGADTAWYLPDTNSSNNRYLCVDASDWTVLFESNQSKYWLLGTASLNRQAIAFNMGDTEPDFS